MEVASENGVEQAVVSPAFERLQNCAQTRVDSQEACLKRLLFTNFTETVAKWRNFRQMSCHYKCAQYRHVIDNH